MTVSSVIDLIVSVSGGWRRGGRGDGGMLTT